MNPATNHYIFHPFQSASQRSKKIRLHSLNQILLLPFDGIDILVPWLTFASQMIIVLVCLVGLRIMVVRLRRAKSASSTLQPRFHPSFFISAWLLYSNEQSWTQNEKEKRER